MQIDLTARQQHELDYHRERAQQHRQIVDAPFSYAVLDNPRRRWWNAYWRMYACIAEHDFPSKHALVIGCGFGDDALRLARLGFTVHAFDLSPDSLAIATALAAREKLSIDFQQMPAERLAYADSMFDLILARDILHHVDIPLAMAQIVRVAKPGALFIADEIYSHSVTDTVRHSRFVEKFLYPRMQRFVYGQNKPYITADERKLTQHDVAMVMAALHPPELKRYFNFIATRLLPDRWDIVGKADQILLRMLRPFAPILAGRILLAARVAKPAPSTSA